jgi:putative tricarboxylic transport membrane protein
MAARYAETIIALILLVLCAVAWIYIGGMRSGADIFPRMIVTALSILSLIYLVRSLLTSRQLAANIFIDKSRFAIVLLLTVIYISSFKFIGYFTATALFIPILSYLIGFKRPIYIIVATLAFLTCLYVMFVLVFRRALPSERIFVFIGGLF